MNFLLRDYPKIIELEKLPREAAFLFDVGSRKSEVRSRRSEVWCLKLLGQVI